MEGVWPLDIASATKDTLNHPMPLVILSVILRAETATALVQACANALLDTPPAPTPPVVIQCAVILSVSLARVWSRTSASVCQVMRWRMESVFQSVIHRVRTGRVSVQTSASVTRDIPPSPNGSANLSAMIRSANTAIA